MNKFKNFFVYSIKTLKGNYIKLLTLTIISVISSLVSLYLPLLSGNFINSLIENPAISTIKSFCKLIIIVNLVNFFLSYVLSIINIYIQTTSSYTLNCNMIKKLQRVSLLNIQKKDITYLNQRINNDCNAIVIFIINLIKDIIVNIISFAVSLVFLYKISNRILWCIFFIFLMYLLLYRIYKGKILIIKRKLLDIQGEYFAKLQEQLQYIKFIKVYNCSKLFISDLNKKFIKLKKMLIKNQNYMYMLNFSEQNLILFAQIFLYFDGGIQVINGKLSIGMFTIMSSYFSNIITSIKYFSNLYQQYLSTYVSYDRIMELEDLENDNNGTVIIENLHSFTLKDINFCYNKKSIINNFSYDFKIGNVYQICGENGKGKTTLINLIIGLYTDYSGNIEVNNINAKNINLYDFRRDHISVIAQNPLLVNGKIYDNLVLDNHFDNNIITRYILEFNLIKDETELDDFLSKDITEFLKNVSGGEGQKLNIIRELLRDKTLMIFDEPTSALDFESKKVLVKYIKQLKANHIIILITHDIFLQENLNMIKINL